MFEAEVEMERRSSFLPLLLMMCLVAAILGLASYIFLQVQARAPLTAEQANAIVAASFQGSTPVLIHFHTGLVKPDADEKPSDPNYRLLEKAGILRLAKAPQGKVAVSLTPKGESLLTTLPGYKKSKEANGTYLYRAPLAQRQLLSVAGTTVTGVNDVLVEYNWKWVSTPLGDIFDASGPLVKSFNTWDRQTLINKYEVDFYHADSTKSQLTLVRDGRDWKVSRQ
jgi:hypothetical protein